MTTSAPMPSGLPVVRAHGTARDRGAALGNQSRDAIHARIRPSAGFRALLPWLGSDRLAALRAASAARFPAYVAELEALAEAAQWDVGEAWLWTCGGDLRAPGGGVTGCTTLFEAGPAGLVIAHNEDGAPEFVGTCFMVDWRPDDGLAGWAFAYPGMLPGNAFAVNARGLVQTINNLRAEDPRPGLPRQMISRAILDAPDLDAALRLLQALPRASGFHHGLAQAGDARLLAVEAPASGLAVHRVKGRHVHANHLIEPTLMDVPQVVSASSAARQGRATEHFVEREAAALDVLLDGSGSLPIHRRGRGDDAYTLATAVFHVTDRGVHLEVIGDEREAPLFHASIRPGG